VLCAEQQHYNDLRSNYVIKMSKIALITGVNGMDGSYCSDILLDKGYHVYGIIRRTSLVNTSRIDHLSNNHKFSTFYGDVTDLSNIILIIKKITEKHPDFEKFEIYNLAAQSHVKVSFEEPIYTSTVDALGTLNVLEAIRSLNLEKSIRFYQASTSELFGKVHEIPQTETTPFHPRSPYGVAKLYSYWIVRHYREAYGMFAVNGILFNHTSPRRGETFVCRKITIAIGQIMRGEIECLYLGNLDSKRDWGHAKDYVEGMWMMLQHHEPDDFVLATGKTYSVRHFVEEAFKCVEINIIWSGKGEDEVGKCSETDKVLVRINKKYFRPCEVDLLLGDASKAKEILGWEAKTELTDIIKDMVLADG
jgi:GDPmannose 4,6-dehydratase